MSHYYCFVWNNIHIERLQILDFEREILEFYTKRITRAQIAKKVTFLKKLS